MAAPKAAPRPKRPKRLTRKEKQAETRRRLLDAGERVFLRRGLQGSTVEEIAAEAGFTRGAFYSNFEGKDELFVELLQDRVYRRYAEMAQDAQGQPGTPRERLRWGIERMREMYEEDQGDRPFAFGSSADTSGTR